MSLECALKILREKELVKIELRGAGPIKPPVCSYLEISSRIQDLIYRIHDKISESTEYICSDITERYNGNKIHASFMFAKVEKVDKWLKDNCKKEETYIIKCEEFIADYIQNYTDYRQSSDCNGYLIINKKIRENRIKKEEKEEEKAIELFESML